MNDINLAIATWGWRLAGWTMIHFLWIGAGVALAGAGVRIACRRSSAGVRYAVSVIAFALIAATPAGIAAWLAMHPEYVATSAVAVHPRALPGGNLAPASHRSTVGWDAVPSFPGAKGGTASQPTITRAPLRAETPTPSPASAARGLEPLEEKNPRAKPEADRWSAVADAAIPYLPWLWLTGSPLTFGLLATGLVGARRLRRTAAPLVDGLVFDACQRMRSAMGVARQVTVAVCDSIAQPILIGILRPCILLPASALAGWTAEELEMVLVHELAHVRRWDNLVNLIQRIVESLLFFHPAVWLVSRQVRRDREDCCDAVVVGRTQRAREYAELLVSVAALRRRELGRRGQAPLLTAASAMADHPLAGRIRRILKLEDEPMLVSRSTVGAAGLAVAALVTAAFLLPLDRGQAEEGTAKDAKATAVPAAESPGIVERNEIRRTSQPGTPPEAINKSDDADRGAPAILIPADGSIPNELTSLKKSAQGVDDVGEENPIVTRVYDSGPILIGCLKCLDGRPELAVTWKERGQWLSIEAPSLVHDVLVVMAKHFESGKSDLPHDQVKPWFVPGPHNEPLSFEYEVQKFDHVLAYPGLAGDALEALIKNPHGPQVEMTLERLSGGKQLRVKAARAGQTFVALILSPDSPAWATALRKLPADSAEGKAAQDSPARGNGDESNGNSKSPSPFLSADDQRAADFVYKLFSWEVEPLSADELAVVKEHGYEGGVRVVATDDTRFAVPPVTLLVGLHTSPIENVQGLADFLARERAYDLSPLRAYLLRGQLNPADWTLDRTRVDFQPEVWRKAVAAYRPPRVVETSPGQGDTIVVPGAAWKGTELRVTFSQPMQDGSWSWSTAVQGEFPELNGQPHYEDDGRTCVLSATLKPNTHYAIWINDQKHKNFKGLDGRPATPHLWEFSTGHEPEHVRSTSTKATDGDGVAALANPFASPSLPGKGTSAPASGGKFYDGKRLEEWQALWTNELKIERRLEALEAIGAFAKAGRAGAVELVLDCATEYPLPPDSTNPPQGDAGEVLLKTLAILSPQTFDRGEPDANPAWLKLLADRLSKDPKRYKNLALNLLRVKDRLSDAAKAPLRELAAMDDLDIQRSAQAALNWVPQWGHQILMCDANIDGSVTVDELDATVVLGPGWKVVHEFGYRASVRPPEEPKQRTEFLRNVIWPLVLVADSNGDGAVTREELAAKVDAIEANFVKYGDQHRTKSTSRVGSGE